MILGVSHDAPAANAAWKKKNGFAFTLLSDQDGAISKAFDSVMPKHADYSRRNTYVIDEEGKIARVLVDVNPSKHAKQLLDELK